MERERPEREPVAPAGEPPAEGLDRVEVGRSPTRCPYCHDSIQEHEFRSAVVCSSCLSRHHQDCWQSTCASCGSGHRAGEDLGSLEEKPKSVAYRAWEWSTNTIGVLSLIATLSAMALGHADQGWLTAIGFLYLFCIVQAYPLNLVDAYKRKRSDPVDRGIIGWFPLAVAASGIAFSVTTFLYFFTWGRRPFPSGEEPGEPAATKETKDQKGQ